MKVVSFKQRSKEWLAWRKEGVAASEASVILKINPYKTYWRLWAEKTELVNPLDLSKNPNVIRGIKYEDAARQILEEKLNQVLLPICAESSCEPTIRASFDGLTDQNQPTEIKCPVEKNFLDFKKNRSKSELFKLYLPQVMHQMFVAESDIGYLCAYYEGEIHYETIRYDKKLIEYLVDAELRFYDQVSSGKEPEKDSDKDIFIPTEADMPAWKNLASQYRSNKMQINDLVARLEQLKSVNDSLSEEMFSLMGDFCLAESSGVKVTRFLRKGSVNYKALLKDFSIEESILESYRSDSTTHSRITLKTEDNAEVNFDQEELDQILKDNQSFWF